MSQSDSVRRALLVIDVQKEYTEGKLLIEYPPPAVSLANIRAAMNTAKDAGIPIILVQQVFPADFPVFAEGSPGAELLPDIAAFPHSLLVKKVYASALWKTTLKDWLSAEGINTLTVCGYMTHNCLNATIQQVWYEDSKLELLEDACGSIPYLNSAGAATAEEIHRAFCVVMDTLWAATVSTHTWIAHIAKGGATATPLEPDNVFASHERYIEGAETGE